MIKIQNKSQCCGCAACASVCPRNCITMKADEEGFLYPQIEIASCVDCGLCERVCPFLAKNTDERLPIYTFAAKNLDNNVRNNSSSGGLFTLFAERVIEDGGIVFGVQFDKEWNVVHGSASTKEELAKFRGSKYVQSSIGDSYIRAKKCLKLGQSVLFSGTSCQIMGLKKFLGKDYPNLLTIDVICHGVPSPAVWKQYLKEIIEVAHKGNHNQFRSVFTNVIPEIDPPIRGALHGISFRDKTYGWRNNCFALSFADVSTEGEKKLFRSLIINDYRSKYFVAFNNNLTIRHSCFNCPAKGGRCGSDITLADFWGIEKELPDFSDDNGVSLCLCNTERGLECFDMLTLNKKEIAFERAISHNRSWRISQTPHPKRNQFFKAFVLDGKVFRNLEKCLNPPMTQRIMSSIKKIVKNFILKQK